MKILIWFLCIFFNALIITSLPLGGLPTFLVSVVFLYLVPRYLCKRWDSHQLLKKARQLAEQLNISFDIPENLLFHYAKDVNGATSYLQTCLEKGLINEKQRITLLESCVSKPSSSKVQFSSDAKLPSLKEYRSKAKATSSDSEITAAAKDLALHTVAAVKVFNQNDNCTYLNKSKATYADTAIFSFFVVRAICIMSTPNRAKAEEFSNAYVSTSKTYAKKTFSLGSSFDKQFDNRTDFYDRIFATKTKKADMLAAVLEEFEFIIKSDILRNGFAPFSESSPLPILDFDEDMHCQFEVNSYYKYLLSGISKKIQHVQSLLN